MAAESDSVPLIRQLLCSALCSAEWRYRFLGQSDIRMNNPSQEITMAKTVSCRDVGMDCDFVAKGETNEDIMQQAAEHARTAHNMTEIPPEVAEKVRGAIRDEAAESLLANSRFAAFPHQSKARSRAPFPFNTQHSSLISRNEQSHRVLPSWAPLSGC